MENTNIKQGEKPTIQLILQPHLNLNLCFTNIWLMDT